MIQIPCQRLAFPWPRYRQIPDADGATNAADGSTLSTNDYKILPISNQNRGSRWKVPDKSVFFTTNPRPFKYRVLRLQKAKPAPDQDPTEWSQSQAASDAMQFDWSVTRYLGEFHRQLVKCGFDPGQITTDTAPTELPRLDHDLFHAALQQAKTDQVDLVVLMLSGSNIPIYATFKALADRESGLQTTCMVQKSFNKEKYFKE